MNARRNLAVLRFVPSRSFVRPLQSGRIKLFVWHPLLFNETMINTQEKSGAIQKMTKSAHQKFAAAICLILSAPTMADPVTVPNTFVSGTPARAVEINENFDALRNAVNANDDRVIQLINRIDALESGQLAQLPVFVKSNGLNFGILLGKSTNDSAASEHYDVLSFKEYLFKVSIQSGSLLGSYTIYFSGQNCTGEAYISVDQQQGALSPQQTYTKFQGEVFIGGGLSNDPYAAYYVAQDTQSVSITPLSAADSGNCSGQQFEHTFPQIEAYPALPNDPDVTGVDNTYQTPIRAGY